MVIKETEVASRVEECRTYLRADLTQFLVKESRISHLLYPTTKVTCGIVLGGVYLLFTRRRVPATAAIVANTLPFNCTMPHPSQESETTSSSHLGSILDVALSDYKQNTGKDLLSTYLCLRLDSVDYILAVLQNHVNALEQLRDGNRGFKLMKWIGSLVHILYPISDGVGLVRPRK